MDRLPWHSICKKCTLNNLLYRKKTHYFQIIVTLISFSNSSTIWFFLSATGCYPWWHCCQWLFDYILLAAISFSSFSRVVYILLVRCILPLNHPHGYYIFILLHLQEIGKSLQYDHHYNSLHWQFWSFQYKSFFCIIIFCIKNNS